MNARAIALALTFAVAGCGGNSVDDTAQQDFAVRPDLAMQQSPPDLAMPGPNLDLLVANPGPDLGQLSCAAMVACTTSCGAQNSGQCVSACIARGSTDAMTWFKPLEDCAGPACSQSDMGKPPCSDPSSAGCLDCVQMNCGAQLAACEQH